MEKLIELLNEYDKINEYINRWFRNEYGCLDREYGWSTVISSCLKVISKDYGFIKWLVDNDKIDYKKLREGREDLCDVNLRHLRNKYIDVVSLSYIKLLMLLSISDNPIDFLVSILK